jgi:hypothetical protein
MITAQQCDILTPLNCALQNGRNGTSMSCKLFPNKKMKKTKERPGEE